MTREQQKAARANGEALTKVFGLKMVREIITVTAKRSIRSPKDVYAFADSLLSKELVEVFAVIVLNAQHELAAYHEVTRGILNSSLVHPREVFRAAICAGAAAVILVHNHPSGDPTPSPDDKAVTEQLVAAGRLLDIPVHDHVICGAGRYTSFAESGLL